MSWGVEIWDQYDKVCAHTDLGIEFIKRVQSFMEKRIYVENSYAKELRKLSKAFRRKDEEESPYTAVRGFAKTVLETNDLAGQRELVAEYMESDVLVPLKTLARDIAVERKKHLASGAECLRQLKVTMDSLERAKKAYEKASEEGENAMHTLEKADNDPNSTKAKIDKLTTILRQKEQTAEDCRNTYILQLEKTNADRQEHFHSTMPAVFKDLQDMNANRITEYKKIISTYSESQRKVLPVVNTCLDNITSSSDNMDPGKDNQQLVEESKTGFPIPGEVEFVEYMGKQAKKSQNKKSKIEIREDYGHLPPEQQRRKLQHKIDQLEALINKTVSDRTAMEKMQTIYTDNPKLGDPNAVAQSLEVCQRRMEELGVELDKYKNYLTSAISRINERPDKRTAPITAKAKLSPRPTKKDSPAGPVGNSTNDHANSSSKDDEFDDDEEDDEEEEPSTPRGGAGAGEEWDNVDSGEARQKAVLIYDFTGQNEDELTCSQHEEVTIIEDLGDGWLRVRKANGEGEGYVPESYVQKK